MSGDQSDLSYTTMSESRYESACEGSIFSGNNSTVYGEDVDGHNISVGTNGTGDPSLVSQDLNALYFSGNTPAKDYGRLSMFSRKQFDPLLKTPGQTGSGPLKSTGGTPDFRALMNMTESDSHSTASTPLTVRSNGGSFGVDADRLIPVTPLSHSNGGNKDSLPSSPSQGNNVVTVKVNGGGTPSTEYKNGHHQQKEEDNQTILALKTANEELTQLFVEMLEVKEREQQQLLERWTQEKDQATEDLRGAEASFNELHGRYERLKGAFSLAKQNEEQALQEREDAKQEADHLRQEVSQLNQTLSSTQETLCKFQKEKKEAASSRIQVQRLELKVSSLETKISGLEAELKQKTQENEKLMSIVDELQTKSIYMD